MPLNPIVPGLRSFRNRSNDVAKLDLRVPAGDVIHVSDEVAAQLDPRTFAAVADQPAEAPAESPAKPGRKKA